MDLRRFDDLATALAVPDSRRRFLGLLAMLPMVGGLLSILSLDDAEGKDRRRRRKQRHKQRGSNRRHPKRDGKRQGQRQDEPTPCTVEPKSATCNGQCGEVRDNCGKAVDCGACTCASACGACLVCDEETDECVADLTQEGRGCGAPGQVCQADGACECDTGSCAPCETCQGNGRCSLPCDGAGCCDATGACHDGHAMDFCGTDGAPCTTCAGEEICRADGQGELCRLNQAPDAFNLTYNDDSGKTCVVTLRGADPDGDPLAFRILTKPSNGKLFLYDESAVGLLGVEVLPGDPAVPAEAGTDDLRLCYKTNNRFFFESDSFRYVSIDTYGAESPISTIPPHKSYIQINIFET